MMCGDVCNGIPASKQIKCCVAIIHGIIHGTFNFDFEEALSCHRGVSVHEVAHTQNMV